MSESRWKCHGKPDMLVRELLWLISHPAEPYYCLAELRDTKKHGRHWCAIRYAKTADPLVKWLLEQGYSSAQWACEQQLRRERDAQRREDARREEGGLPRIVVSEEEQQKAAARRAAARKGAQTVRNRRVKA